MIQMSTTQQQSHEISEPSWTTWRQRCLMQNFSEYVALKRRRLRNWARIVWRTRPCGTEGECGLTTSRLIFRQHLNKCKLWIPLIVNSSLKINILFYNGSSTFREDCSRQVCDHGCADWGTCHCTVDFNYQGFLQLPSCQSLSFILLPRIWNVRFYAQELNLVNWGWRSSLLQQVVIWPDCLDVWLKCHRPSTLSQVY